MEYGLETGDIDIFKKDPIGSLAREICQNSIDANRGIHPTRIEFSTFDVARMIFQVLMNYLSKLKLVTNIVKMIKRKVLLFRQYTL